MRGNRTKQSSTANPIGVCAPCWLVLLGLILFPGCAAIPIHEQGLASKRSMSFSEPESSSFESAIVSQIEPGTGIGNGSQAAGCVACR